MQPISQRQQEDCHASAQPARFSNRAGRTFKTNPQDSAETAARVDEISLSAAADDNEGWQVVGPRSKRTTAAEVPQQKRGKPSGTTHLFPSSPSRPTIQDGPATAAASSTNESDDAVEWKKPLQRRAAAKPAGQAGTRRALRPLPANSRDSVASANMLSASAASSTDKGRQQLTASAEMTGLVGKISLKTSQDFPASAAVAEDNDGWQVVGGKRATAAEVEVPQQKERKAFR